METENTAFAPQSITPIAYICTDFPEKFGIPRQSGRVPELKARIIFLPAYRVPEALRGIEEFSHLWLLFDFSLSHRENWSPTVRPPRLGGNTRIGVFATRSPFRPNPIGLSCVKLLSVEHTQAYGDTLVVAGADLLDGTPIFDIKPYLPAADCQPQAKGSYADANSGHCLQVNCAEEYLCKLPQEKRAALLACLADDPRPSYQHDPARCYSMKFAGFDVHFTVDGEILTVIGVDSL